ncbi:hypothetical protein [Clostridium amazonitimonense]|nr:hypothetical protein [Clostridium amazonitimonense]
MGRLYFKHDFFYTYQYLAIQAQFLLKVAVIIKLVYGERVGGGGH